MRTLAVAVFVVVIALAPRFVAPFVAFELTYVGAYAIAILGLVILTGYSGQISLGHGAFMAIGGYTVAVLALRAGIGIEVSILLAAAICAVFGLAIGFVALRLADVYLALATFALATSVPPILKRFKVLTGGVQGLSLPHVAVPGPMQSILSPEAWLYYVAWSILGVLFGIAWLVLRGRVGRSLRAIRDSQVAAVAFGVNPTFYKTIAFGWSAAYAGVAGALLALATAYVSPDVYNLNLSLTLLIGVVLGGLHAFWGAIIGGVVVEFLPLWAQKINPAASSMVYGVALMLVMMFMPGGIANALERLVRTLRPIPVRDLVHTVHTVHTAHTDPLEEQ
ncbi:MAG: branched-chain amino acid ABC transporter permease [Candidatus Eremiobacteraeota bacterium]|nr:branched-chain amino acid ABC transporter permease [Candidatus Eremiobacteraeota bacterium]MBV8356153.1 branched-chain amino acid ABC transporter permease [Candidatus Eremiobacteraeota bacterium]